jgi:quinol monooxygenase YgiN
MAPFRIIAAGALLAMGMVTLANAQAPAPTEVDPSAPVYVVAYVDVVVAAKPQAMRILKQYRTACSRESGNLRCEAAQRMEQQNEFVVLEVWKDLNSYRAHSAAAGAQLRNTLKPISGGPYDERIHRALSAPAPQPPPNGRVVYVVTHVDVIPPRLNDALGLLAPMAEAGRKDAGNERLDVLQQHDRSNHFSIVEIWSNKRQLENHQANPRTIQFRNAIQPSIGGLYDERLYKVLD